ncbi:MAG: hypothetical protein ACI861_000816 [Paracoccaceae bacterium]|jgi:hypothetical protein
MRYLTATIVFLSAVNLTFSSSAEDAEHYYGVGWQDDGNHWSIEVLLSDKSAQIVYPSLECSGDWTLVSATSDQLHFIETIVDGKEDCVETGDIFLDPLPNGGYLYSWNAPGQSTAARAILFAAIAGRLTYMEQLMVTLDSVELGYMQPEFLE